MQVHITYVFIREAGCNIYHNLVIVKVRERLSEKATVQKFDMQSQFSGKLSSVEVKEQHPVTVRQISSFVEL